MKKSKKYKKCKHVLARIGTYPCISRNTCQYVPIRAMFCTETLEPGNKSSELVVPERRPSRVYPKLEEQSVGGGDALPPRSPDAQQIRLPGGSPNPPVLSEKGLVDGAVCPEEPSRGGKPGIRPGK